ncbi:hypothetical protein PO878_18350 [Iamia majanohamensis]|uniref:Uncharacterized protein n=1 Tax=Iamia majanohamensis TaxID=467976 RepID=A0AAE9Y8J8_9ACTN|nr:hypothetical protein [Iamia majanohamensis]WCO66463.1 hypothetical protein PO878_18350 [Iamia majanohamensis]
MASTWVRRARRLVSGPAGARRADGPFASLEARIVLLLLVITALAAVLWIGAERGRDDGRSAGPAAAVVESAG